MNREDDFVEDHAHVEETEQSHTDKTIMEQCSCKMHMIINITGLCECCVQTYNCAKCSWVVNAVSNSL